MAAKPNPYESADQAERRLLADDILAAIARGPEGDPSIFDDLVRRVFAHQYASSEVYREFCDLYGANPDALESWANIPALPTQTFKQRVVTSFPVDEAVQALRSSGTTSATFGKVFRDEIGMELVMAANRMMTGAYLFPDFEAGQRCRILVLAPSPQMAPSMGFAIGLDQTRRHFGTEDSTFLVDMKGLDVRTFVDALRHAEATGEPLAAIGSTSAFVYFFNACRREGMSFRLPEGSRIADGGGYRGRFGEVSRDDYYRMCEDFLGVPSAMCVNILGMSESATNYADDTLRRALLGLRARPRQKAVPPWARTSAVSVEDLTTVLPPGEVGLLRHCDAANLPTVVCVQTDNLGYTTAEGGFEIVGRARVDAGGVSQLPSLKPVGPMGDKRIFGLLESYVNFTIDFKMKRVGRVEQPEPGRKD